LGLSKKFLISEESGTELEFPKEHIPEAQDVKSPVGLALQGADLQDLFKRILAESSSCSWTYDSEDRPVQGDFLVDSVLTTRVNYSYTGDVPTQILVKSYSGAVLVKTVTYTLSWTADKLTGVSSSV
jgi:hypothetical protein